MRMDDLHRQSAFAGSEMPLFAAFNSGFDRLPFYRAGIKPDRVKRSGSDPVCKHTCRPGARASRVHVTIRVLDGARVHAHSHAREHHRRAASRRHFTTTLRVSSTRYRRLRQRLLTDESNMTPEFFNFKSRSEY